MNVGDYVRFNYHRVSTPIQIAKITETHYDSEDDSICYSTDIGLVIDESNLVQEPSPKIIDLIEVGDYVNGGKVLEKKIEWIEFYDVDKLTYLYIVLDGKKELIYEKDIKSIVTREMFEQMKYEVK